MLLLEGKANFKGCGNLRLPSSDALQQAPPEVVDRLHAIKEVDLSGLDDDRFRGVHLADVWTALEPRRPADLSHQHWTDLTVARYCARAGELRPLAGMEELLAAARKGGRFNDENAAPFGAEDLSSAGGECRQS